MALIVYICWLKITISKSIIILSLITSSLRFGGSICGGVGVSFGGVDWACPDDLPEVYREGSAVLRDWSILWTGSGLHGKGPIGTRLKLNENKARCVLALTATATAVAKGVAKDVLYLNAWWRIAIVIAANSDMAWWCLQLRLWLLLRVLLRTSYTSTHDDTEIWL